MKKKIVGWIDLTKEELRTITSVDIYDEKGNISARADTKKQCRQNIKDFREVGVKVKLYRVVIERVE